MKLTETDKSFLNKLDYTYWKSFFDTEVDYESVQVLVYAGLIERNQAEPVHGISTQYRRTQKSKDFG